MRPGNKALLLTAGLALVGCSDALRPTVTGDSIPSPTEVSTTAPLVADIAVSTTIEIDDLPCQNNRSNPGSYVVRHGKVVAKFDTRCNQFENRRPDAKIALYSSPFPEEEPVVFVTTGEEAVLHCWEPGKKQRDEEGFQTGDEEHSSDRWVKVTLMNSNGKRYWANSVWIDYIPHIESDIEAGTNAPIQQCDFE